MADDNTLWNWYKVCISREQDLVKLKEGLTEQINRQNQNLHSMSMQCHNFEQTIIAANSRCKQYEAAYNDSQRVQGMLAQQLEEETQKNKKMSLELEFEFKEHAKTEKELERHYITLNRLSEFLTVVQVASKEDKALVMDGFNNENNLGNLMLEIEDKKQYIGNLEEKLKFAKHEFEASLASHEQAMALKEREIAELESLQPHGGATVSGPEQGSNRASSDRRKSKSSRKSS